MKILSVIFTLLALLAAGGSAGVHIINKDKLTLLTSEIDATSQKLQETQNELGKVRADALRSEQLLSNVRTELAEAKTQNTRVSRELIEVRTLSNERAALVENSAKEVATLRQETERLRQELLTRAPQNQQRGEVSLTSREAAEYQAKLSEMEATIITLRNELASARNQPGSRSTAQQTQTQTVSALGSEGKDFSIARINLEAGILVLDAGITSGMVQGRIYNLTRGEYTLARIRVSSNTAEHTIGSIIPDIGIPGSLRSGDVVRVSQ